MMTRTEYANDLAPTPAVGAPLPEAAALAKPNKISEKGLTYRG